MKDSLFEMLMNFFEKSLSEVNDSKTRNDDADDLDAMEQLETISLENQSLTVRAAHDRSIRVFTGEEQMKLTKASYQFLMRVQLWGVVASETMEHIINQLLFSESRFVTLQETKWTIRNTLAENLDASQLNFLDLVLYQKEDEISLH